jgi:hypothetical protein
MKKQSVHSKGRKNPLVVRGVAFWDWGRGRVLEDDIGRRVVERVSDVVPGR